MTICKAAAPYELGRNCDLPSTEWTPIGATVQCPSCKTWYRNKQFGTFGGLWVLLPKNPTCLKSTPIEVSTP